MTLEVSSQLEVSTKLKAKVAKLESDKARLEKQVKEVQEKHYQSDD